MSRATDGRADLVEPVAPAPDEARREVGPKLADRLTELPAAHPSSADYASDQRQALRADSRERPDHQALTPDKGADLPPGGREMAPDWGGDTIVPTDRRGHILDGEPGDGGGHRHGTGQPDKTEFPADWSDDRIIDAVLAVVRNPDQPPELQDWNERWQVSGSQDGVGIVAVVEPDGKVWTAWPLDGSPGVVRNPVEEANGRE